MAAAVKLDAAVGRAERAEVAAKSLEALTTSLTPTPTPIPNPIPSPSPNPNSNQAAYDVAQEAVVDGKRREAAEAGAKAKLEAAAAEATAKAEAAGRRAEIAG